MFHPTTATLQWPFLKSRPPHFIGTTFFNIDQQLQHSGWESAKGMRENIKTNYLEQILKARGEVNHVKIKPTVRKSEACFNRQ